MRRARSRSGDGGIKNNYICHFERREKSLKLDDANRNV